MTLRYDSRSRVSTYTQSWVSNTDPDFGAFESIATTTVGVGGATEVIFSSIPQTYKHLQIRGSVRNAVTEGNLNSQFNSDTASNYAFHQLTGDGGSVASYPTAPTSYITHGNFSGVSDIFTGVIIDIFDYADTNKNKTTKNFCSFDRNGQGSFYFNSGHWRSTSAITTIRLFAGNNTMGHYSRFALYGIKG